jgi:hypothetical protein
LVEGHGGALFWDSRSRPSKIHAEAGGDAASEIVLVVLAGAASIANKERTLQGLQ